jgi:hypothetical protein
VCWWYARPRSITGSDFNVWRLGYGGSDEAAALPVKASATTTTRPTRLMLGE